jgi:TPP-dependent 2-oxoacid decarboxylase
LQVHIANRLVEIGCRHCFAVPGDFNLLLLDQLLKNPELNMVWCCNELNAGAGRSCAGLAMTHTCTKGDGRQFG